MRMILLVTVASCYCQSLRKIHVRIESLLRINFELIFQSHTARYMLVIYIFMRNKKMGAVGTAQKFNFHMPHLRYTGFD